MGKEINSTPPGAGMELLVSNECRLKGAPEAVQEALRRALTIDNPKYQAAKRYSRWVGKQLKPKLFFFRDEAGVMYFPRGFANEAMRLCNRLSGARPELIDHRRLLESLDLQFQGQLRPYQQQAVETVLRRSFGVLEAATGSGKTVMALAVLAARRQPTLILVHSRELLHQWRERIRQYLGLEAGQAGDGHFEPAAVTVAIVNTARTHLKELVPCFGQLIVDECHRVPASLFTSVVSAFDCHYMLGLSATAFRREDGMTRLIYISLGDPLHQVDPATLAASGAVLRPEYIQRETWFSHSYRGEYAALLKALAADQARNRQIITDLEALLRQGHQGTVLVVSDRVAHCEELARMLAERSIPAAVLTGQVGAEQRSGIVQAVQQGAVQVLIATIQLIGEGFDCAGLTTLVLVTPIKFEGRLLQVVGRILRPADGKNARVIDYVDSRIPALARSAGLRAEVFGRWDRIPSS